MKKTYQLIFCIGLLSTFLHGDAAIILSGQSNAAEGETFTISVNQIEKAEMSGAIYSSKATDGAGSFSIDRIFEGQAVFAPVISQKVLLKDEQENKQIDNPLFNKAIQSFGLFELEVNLFSKKEALLVTTVDEPQFIYFTEPVNAQDETVIAQLERTASLRDASGVEGAQVQTLTTDRIGAVFAAVAPAGGNFGDVNSGIALAVRAAVAVQNGDQQTQEIRFNQFVSAVRLDGTEGATNIGANATVDTPVDMYWDPILKRLFIALQVTSGAGGATRALVVGRIGIVGNNRVLTFERFIPDDPVADNNQIVATGLQDTPVSLHKVRVMHTSTGLSYAIVVGNNGEAADTQSDVFALPLVSSGDLAGTLAAKDNLIDPVTEFLTTGPGRFKSRDFTQAVTVAGDVIRNDGDDEVIARVGREQLAAGAITDLLVVNDTVFATVGNPVENGLAGVYSSRALFSANGKIKGWTQWQRATGTTDQVFNITCDKSDGSTVLFSGIDANNVKTVKKTTWTNENKITRALDQLLSSDDGNTQQLYSFVQQPGVDMISLLAVADVNTLALINTGQAHANGTMMPTGNEAVTTFENGNITSNVNGAFAIGISGPVLEGIGPITTVTLARNTNEDQTFIFVGGIHGIAVLADGTGVGVAGQIQPGLVGIVNGMSMQEFGDFSHVRKLFADDNFLYVLTDEQLVGINLNDNTVVTDPFVSRVLATREDLGVNSKYGSLLDVIVSDRVAFIATTNGLFVNGPTTNIQVMPNAQDAEWTQIGLPECLGVPIALTTATSTNNDRDVARDEGGNVFVLCADRGNNRSRLHRIALDMQDGELRPVLFEDVLLEDDVQMTGEKTFFLNFGQHKNIFFSDGARCFIGQNKNITGDAVLGLLNQKYPPRVGVANIGNQCISVNALLQGATEISGFISDRAAGSYVVSGDHGLSIHE